MQADNQQCRFGINCKYLKQDTCFRFHPQWHKQMVSNQNQRDSNKNHCHNGPGCRFLKQDRCHFYHPPSHRKNQSESRTVIYNSIFDSSFEALIRQMREAKKKKEEEERKKRQRQQELVQIRRRQILRFIELQNLREATRTKQAKKSNPENFEWYFGKNKTFKAMEISEEKLEQLDQCVICFVSFTGQNSEKIGQENEQSSKFESQQKKIEQKKEHLHLELTELYCKHTFHKQCIKKWLTNTENCPICRKDFKDHDEYKKWEEQRKKLKAQQPSRLSMYGSYRSIFQSMILNPFVEQREYVGQVESDDDDDDVGYLDYDEDDYNESGLYDEYDMSDNEY